MGAPQVLGFGLCPLYFKICIVTPDDVIRYHGFQELLRAGVLQGCTLSLDLD